MLAGRAHATTQFSWCSGATRPHGQLLGALRWMAFDDSPEGRYDSMRWAAVRRLSCELTVKELLSSFCEPENFYYANIRPLSTKNIIYLPSLLIFIAIDTARNKWDLPRKFWCLAAISRIEPDDLDAQQYRSGTIWWRYSSLHSDTNKLLIKILCASHCRRDVRFPTRDMTIRFCFIWFQHHF